MRYQNQSRICIGFNDSRHSFCDRNGDLENKKTYFLVLISFRNMIWLLSNYHLFNFLIVLIWHLVGVKDPIRLMFSWEKSMSKQITKNRNFLKMTIFNFAIFLLLCKVLAFNEIQLIMCPETYYNQVKTQNKCKIVGKQ